MRKVWDIHGGIHPAENKTQSNQSPIVSAGIPSELIFPLSQHIGAPAAPIVTIGDRVLKGQMIAEAKGFVSVPVHASSSGEVIAIEERAIPHPSGMSAPCIVVKTDGKDQWVEHQGLADYRIVEKSVLLETIRQAGIAGMGGAGFPSAVKLTTRDDKPIETLIINGTECEPYITADDRLMRERAEQIIGGASILRHLIEPTQETLIGVEDNKPEAIAALQKAAAGTGIEVVVFPTKYPSGGEKQLIQILTGKEVPAGGLPADVGIICQNIGTTAAIYKAVTLGEPLISRITTVTGEACDENKNFEVLLGTPARFLLEQCGFREKDCVRLIMGGPMMGYTINSADLPLVKASNCLLAPSKKELPPPPPAQACIRCGMCAEACPVSLLPQQMYWFARGKEYDKLEAHNLADCIECGACSFACPSNIPLVQYFRASKADIRQNKLDAEKAEHSKARFEARQARLEREEAEKEAKRKARQEAAKAKAAAAAAGNGDKKDAVQEAIERAKAKKAAVDPAQAAIEKAMAKRAGGASEAPTQESLEQAVAAAEKRLNASKTKLEQARADGADTVAAFETAVAKTEQKLADARQKLAAFQAEQAPATPAAVDPAQAAIEKALAKRAGNAVAEAPSLESLQKAVATAEKKLSGSQQKLADAEAEGSDTADALRSAVTKMQQKLDDAKAKLAEFEAANATAAEPTAADPAQAAIEKALAKRAGTAVEQAPTLESLQQAVATAEKKLSGSQQKLADAEAEGSDTASALRSAVTKMQQKLDDAKAKLAEFEAQQAPAATAPDEPAATGDAAQDAIARAMAKRAAEASMTPEQKLQQKISSMEARLAKSRDKLAAAQAEGSDTADILADTIDKLEQKLADARDELAASEK